MLEAQPIDEIAAYLRDSQDRSNKMFENELSFVTEWNAELYC